MKALDAALAALARGEKLHRDQVAAAIEPLLDGQATEAQTAALLTALRVAGETPDMLVGVVRAVRSRMTRIDLGPGLVDTCGTGGDGQGLFNVSTATAIVGAASGLRVAKHGNRAASGRSGSSEVLETLGVRTEVPVEIHRRCVEELGLTFLLAPQFHPALAKLAPIRRQLPFRTVFNLVGPLVNPASPERQLIGVSDAKCADLMASVLIDLGLERAVVVTGDEGLDEVSLAGATHVRWLEHGVVWTREWTPRDFGLSEVSLDELRVDSPAESAALIRAVLDGDAPSARRMVLANTAAALVMGDVETDLEAGVERAGEAIDSGAATRLLARWSEITRQA